MKTLVVGAGALGGIIAGRLLHAGADVSLATRDDGSADVIGEHGLSITGVSGDVHLPCSDVGPLGRYSQRSFELIVLATKGQQAIEIAPELIRLLSATGTLLPIQNGGVPQLLGERFGFERVLGGLSNLGATMVRHGLYEQRNAGYILIGELAGGYSDRAHCVEAWLSQGVGVSVSENLRGAMWSKLLLNCSVTTIGAVLGMTMKQYIGLPEARRVFHRIYDETLRVALVSGEVPEKMLVDPVPPDSNSNPHEADRWLEEILTHYGSLKPSMLQDFERGRTTEIDFINGYVVDLGSALKVPTPMNQELVRIVKAITNGSAVPSSIHLRQLVRHLL